MIWVLSFLFVGLNCDFWVSAPGISASPSEDNMRYFNVMILGPTQSPYEGKSFVLRFLVYFLLMIVSWLVVCHRNVIKSHFGWFIHGLTFVFIKWNFEENQYFSLFVYVTVFYSLFWILVLKAFENVFVFSFPFTFSMTWLILKEHRICHSYVCVWIVALFLVQHYSRNRFRI